jgi:hypothetical protein
LVVDFGEMWWCEDVKLLTVVDLSKNRRRQDASTAGDVGLCTGPNWDGPIRRATTPIAAIYMKLGTKIGLRTKVYGTEKMR